MASTGYKIDVAQFGAKAESTEGTAESIAATEATMQAANCSHESDIPFVQVEAISATHARFTGIASGPRVSKLGVDLTLKGSGTAGTAPAIDCILEAAGLLGVNSAGTSETYKDTVHGTAMTAAYWIAKDITDGFKYILHGARCESLEFNLSAGIPPVTKASIVGGFSVPTEVNMLADVAYESTAGVANIGGAFTLDSQNLKFKEFTIRIENELAVRPIVVAGNSSGVFSVIIAKQRIVGTMEIEAEDPATWDAYTELTTNQEWALSLPIGSVAGNIITITAPKVQIMSIGDNDSDGILHHTLELAFNRSGNTSPYALQVAFT